MDKDRHFAALEKMYLAGPINALFQPSIHVDDGRATVEIEVSEQLFHSAGAVHGSVYFKMLDDAAFFAANSLEREFFVLTSSFNIYLTRPVSEGRIRSVGRVVSRGRSQILAEAVAYDGRDKEIGRGSGVFVKSRRPLSDVPGYG